jgi:hypothetical protein
MSMKSIGRHQHPANMTLQTPICSVALRYEDGPLLLQISGLAAAPGTAVGIVKVTENIHKGASIVNVVRYLDDPNNCSIAGT